MKHRCMTKQFLRVRRMFCPNFPKFSWKTFMRQTFPLQNLFTHQLSQTKPRSYYKPFGDFICSNLYLMFLLQNGFSFMYSTTKSCNFINIVKNVETSVPFFSWILSEFLANQNFLAWAWNPPPTPLLWRWYLQWHFSAVKYMIVDAISSCR